MTPDKPKQHGTLALTFTFDLDGLESVLRAEGSPPITEEDITALAKRSVKAFNEEFPPKARPHVKADWKRGLPK